MDSIRFRLPTQEEIRVLTQDENTGNRGDVVILVTTRGPVILQEKDSSGEWKDAEIDRGEQDHGRVA